MKNHMSQIAKEYRRRRNNFRYFYLSKKKAHKNDQPKPKRLKPEPKLPSKERVLENLSGKLASVREITKNVDAIKKPTKQLELFKVWLKEYEDQLLDEWNRANER